MNRKRHSLSLLWANLIRSRFAHFLEFFLFAKKIRSLPPLGTLLEQQSVKQFLNLISQAIVFRAWDL